MAEGADRTFAIAFNQRVWALLEADTRTPAEDEEMIHAAHASYLHWAGVGAPANRQRGLWLLFRVYVALGLTERAVHYAACCREETDAFAADMADFDLAYAREAEARAAALARAPDWEKMRDEAAKLRAEIKGDKDREIFEADLAAAPWGRT